jgi:hypothetical protein
VYDPEKALALQLRQPYANSAEAANDYLGAVGIRAKLRPLERGALNQQFMEKKLRNIIQAVSGSFGNAATRFETLS